ncbi:unnamed protein product [Citrullus colocynthis]|uniref:Copper amine oxidase catalytic domain-containing protein n=1 Tax=Citrullus colocynthis TaxID=252529 RepID=A0ABP0Z8H0_9ROSI
MEIHLTRIVGKLGIPLGIRHWRDYNIIGIDRRHRPAAATTSVIQSPNLRALFPLPRPNRGMVLPDIFGTWQVLGRTFPPSSLNPFTDIPANAVFFDGFYASQDGLPGKIPNFVCVFEKYAGRIARHLLEIPGEDIYD